MSKVTKNVRDLADIIKEQMEGTNGAFTTKDDKAITKAALAGEESTFEELKRVTNAQANLAQASGLALAEVGSKAMAKDKDIKQSTLTTKMHKTKVKAAYSRSKTFPDGNGGMAEKKGALQVSVKAGGINGAQFNEVKNIAARLMAEI